MAKTYGALRILSLSPEQASIRINVVVNELETQGISKIQPFTIGKIESEMKQYANENNIEMAGDEIVITVKQISHSLRGSKERDGKTVSPEHLAEFPTRRAGMEIYHDGKAFIYFDRERNEKFIVHSNYNLKVNGKKGKVVNYITAGKSNSQEFMLKKYKRVK